jgi:anti-sigma B factor antagonist
MRISERTVGDVTVLELEGRLILGDEGELPLRDSVNRLVAEQKIKILLDLRKVTRLDSAGVGMLVSKYLTAYHKGGRVKLLHLTNRADQLMKLTKLATVFEMYESEDEAIESFGRPPRALPGMPGYKK